MAKLITVLNKKGADVKYTSDNGLTGVLNGENDVINVFNEAGEPVYHAVGNHITIKDLVEYVDGLRKKVSDENDQRYCGFIRLQYRNRITCSQ